MQLAAIQTSLIGIGVPFLRSCCFIIANHSAVASVTGTTTAERSTASLAVNTMDCERHEPFSRFNGTILWFGGRVFSCPCQREGCQVAHQADGNRRSNRKVYPSAQDAGQEVSEGRALSAILREVAGDAEDGRPLRSVPSPSRRAPPPRGPPPKAGIRSPGCSRRDVGISRRPEGVRPPPEEAPHHGRAPKGSVERRYISS